MKHTIAVEQNLTPVINYLSQKGYKVETVNITSEYSPDIDKYDALVITGMNRNILGFKDTISRIPVIDADGLSPDKIYNQLKNSFKQ